MISIALDLSNKQKKTSIDYIGSVTFPSGYIEHLIRGLDYTSFLPFIMSKPTRQFFVYWQPYVKNSLSLEYLSDLRSRLVHKYYVGDIMKVTDLRIEDFREKEVYTFSGVWENSKVKLKGVFETIAFQHNDFLVIFDISTTEKDPKGKAMEELRNIRSTLELI
jgi:hypothetical protein